MKNKNLISQYNLLLVCGDIQQMEMGKNKTMI